MLGDEEILRLIGTRAIDLSYAFLPNVEGAFLRQARALRPGDDQAARNFLEDHLIRSRIALTLGPLVKPVSHARYVPKSKRFLGHSRIVDLRRCTDGWSLLPGQSAVVCTNEHFRLSHDIVALIIGRVSSYNNGLVTATSYLDSGWDGIVKLLLINSSQKPARLTLGMEVGRIFFVQTSSASLDTSCVGRQGVHYGLNWPRILDDRIDPFPQPPAAPRARLRVTAAAANEVLQRYAGVGLVALALTGVVGAGKLYTDLSKALTQSDAIQSLSERVTHNESRMQVGGSAQIQVAKGSDAGEVVVTMPKGVLYRGANSVSSATLRTGPAGTIVESNVEQDTVGGVVLRLRARIPSPANAETQVTVTWNYVP